MTLDDWMFAFVFLVTVLCAVACWLCWRTAYRDGVADGTALERERGIARRAAASQPTTALLYDPPGSGPGWADDPADTDVDAWLASLGHEPAPAGRHHRPDSPGYAPAPDNWTTGTLALLPDLPPGYLAAPANPGALLGPADTGAFRAQLVQRTDAFIAQITAESS